jgi:large subunit ribosomal protein L31e
MKTKDVRIHPDLNALVWSNGIRNVPFRLRIRCARLRNEDEVEIQFNSSFWH